MGGCCSSEEEDEERRGLVISEPTAVSSSNPLATAPIALESPIKSSTGGTPPPGPRLPPRRIRSTGPLPHAHEDAQQGDGELVERPVTVVPVDPAPPALLSASQKLSPRPGPEAKAAAAAAAKTASDPPPAAPVAVEARKESKKEKKEREKKEKKEKKAKKEAGSSAKKEKKEKMSGGGLFGLFSSSSSSSKDKPADLVIGGPTGFRREQHIGWDPEKGFDLQNLPPQWQTLFSKAGVTESELRNKDTSLFIINVVAASLGSSAFKPQSTYTPLSGSQSHPAAAPAQIAKTESADAGSPPPGEASVSAESSQSSYTSFSQLTSVDTTLSSVAKPTPPAASPRTSAAPPVPPPRSDSLISDTTTSADSTPSPAQPTALPPSAPKAPPAPAPLVKTAPSAAIKPPPAPPAAERPPPPPSRTDTEDLLAAIRTKGAGGLRKVEAPPDLKKLSQQEENSLASILSRAMEARRAYLREDQKDDTGDAGGWD